LAAERALRSVRRAFAFFLVVRMLLARHHDDRDALESRRLFDRGRECIAVHAVHREIGEDDVRRRFTCFAHRGFRALNGDDVRIFALERELQDSAHGHAVVRNQNVHRHAVLLMILAPARDMARMAQTMRSSLERET
jgi:hypothetical protein